MALYFCVFDGDQELDGVDVGSYEDYSWFLSTVTTELENLRPGLRYPTLVLHPECDGAWDSKDCRELEAELADIEQRGRSLPPVPFRSAWQSAVALEVGLVCRNLADCFIDVNGESLLARLRGLARLAAERGFPLLMQ